MSDEAGTGKIHIDSDWKEEAQRDKERLAEEEQASTASESGPLPKPMLADLLNMIAMPAVMAIGGYRTPEGKVLPPDLNLAKYHIDVLELVEEKTKGNVTEEEAKMLASTLHQLRAQFTLVASGEVPVPMPEPPGQA